MSMDRVYFQSIISELPSDLPKGIVPGDILKVKVIEALNNKVILNLKGMLITAKAEIDLTVGEELMLKFDGVCQGQLIFKKVKGTSAGENRENNVAEVLREIGINDSEENVEIANKLLEYKLPVNKDIFSKVVGLLYKLGLTDQSLDTVMHILKGDVPFAFFIPLNINGELFNSKIWVSDEGQNDKNNIGSNKTKICFKVETKNMGVAFFEIDISYKKLKGILCVEKDETIDFLNRHIHKLKDALIDIGYLAVDIDIKAAVHEESSALITDNKISRIDIRV